MLMDSLELGNEKGSLVFGLFGAKPSVAQGLLPGSALRIHSCQAWETIWDAGDQPELTAYKASILATVVMLIKWKKELTDSH